MELCLGLGGVFSFLIFGYPTQYSAWVGAAWDGGAWAAEDIDYEAWREM